MTANTTTTIKPAQIWASMAQATPRAFKAIFIEHAESLAGSYTGVKQLANALTRVQEHYGLKPVFNKMLKACNTSASVADVFAVGMAHLLESKEPKAKTPEVELIAKRINALDEQDRVALFEMLKVNSNTKATTKADEPALI